jgi:hypothetical protein
MVKNKEICMYFTDRGIEELAEQRGHDEVSLGWLAFQLQAFTGLYPQFAAPVSQLATWLARAEREDEGEE